MLIGVAAILKAIAWPTTTVAIAWIFRSALRGIISGPVTDMLSRATEWVVSPSGAKLVLAPRQQQPPETLDNKVREIEYQPTSETDMPPESDVYAAMEENSRRWLIERFGSREDLKLAWALRGYAKAMTERIHKENFRNMFGSQYMPLNVIRASGGHIEAGEAEALFTAEKRCLAPIHDNRTFETWLAWPLTAGLLARADSTVMLTPAGKDFLSYADANGLSVTSPRVG